MDIIDYAVQNPWWKGKEFITQDKHIREYLEKTYQWRSTILDKSELLPGNIFSIRGPRQVGKTTLVKLLIKSLIDKGINENSCFYASCDVLIDHKELLDLIRSFQEFADFKNLPNRYIFLDEISDIKNWQKAVKLLADSGELANVCLVLTGSHTLDIKYGFERLPGRYGKHGKDYLLLPLTFSEFLSLVNPDITKNFKYAESLSLGDINSAAYNIMPFEKDVKRLFHQYLCSGGFPLAINEFYSNTGIPEYIYELYTRWVIGDIVKWGKQEKILKQMLRTVIVKQSTPVSWDSFAKDAEIKSHKTVSSYAEDLENMFVLFVLYYIDLNKKIADYNKNKKIYFFDPFIYHMFNRWLFFKEAQITPQLIESVAVVLFARFAQKSYPHANANEVAFYWMGKKETDIVLRDENRLLGVEVKYKNRISKQDFSSLYHFKEGIVASRSTFKPDDTYSIIPVHILLGII